MEFITSLNVSISTIWLEESPIKVSSSASNVPVTVIFDGLKLHLVLSVKIPVVPPVDFTWWSPDHLPEPPIYIQSLAENKLERFTTEEAPENVNNN